MASRSGPSPLNAIPVSNMLVDIRVDARRNCCILIWSGALDGVLRLFSESNPKMHVCDPIGPTLYTFWYIKRHQLGSCGSFPVCVAMPLLYI